VAEASFGSLRLWTWEVFDFACLLASLGLWLNLLCLITPLVMSCFCTCSLLIFPLAVALFVNRLVVDLHGLSTWFVFRLGFRLYRLRLLCSRCL